MNAPYGPCRRLTNDNIVTKSHSWSTLAAV